MPTQYKKSLQLRKRRLKNIYKYDVQFKIDNYLIVTDDYYSDEVEIPITNLTKQIPVDFENDINKTVQNIPLWDWFTIANLKTNKIWYCDFSTPYYEKDVDHSDSNVSLKRYIATTWAESEIPFKFKKQSLPNKMYSLEVIEDKKLLQNKKNFYLENNDWGKTFSTFDLENEAKKNWDQEFPLVYSNGKYDMGIVIPYSFINLSIKKCFEKSIKLFFNGKQGNRKKALELISETEYKKFLK